MFLLKHSVTVVIWTWIDMYAFYLLEPWKRIYVQVEYHQDVNIDVNGQTSS